MPRPKTSPSDLNRPKRVTLQDVAKAAGLHVMTVSDALSGARIVAPATRERVKAIARELHYIPNSAARALATGRTGVIAVMSGPVDEPYFGTLVRLLGKQMNAEGYRILLTPTDVADLNEAAGNTAIDGAIAIDRHDLIEQFRSFSPVPCVSIGTYAHAFVDNVLVDMTAGVESAIDLMLADQRRRIAYLVTAQYLAQPTEVRAGAYLNAMEKAELRPEIINVDTDFLPMVAERLKAYVIEKGCPSALLCQNDETAMSACWVLRTLGYRIPDDVMLVGCDGQLHMQYFDPPLSTIAQPLAGMASTAWHYLKNRMADSSLPFQHAVLQGELVVRESLLVANRSLEERR